MDTDDRAGRERRERFFAALDAAFRADPAARLILSKPLDAASDWRRSTARPLTVRGTLCAQVVDRHRTHDVTQNPPLDEGLARLRDLLGGTFGHGHLLTCAAQWQLTISRRGKIGLLHRPAASTPPPEAAQQAQHNRAKRRAVALDEPFLRALGLTDGAGRLVPSMARKYKQIGKFVEVLDHALDVAAVRPGAQGLRVLDFGAGKGYLTFALHHHLSVGRGWPAHTTGVELRPALVDEANAAAARCAMAGLDFECGDVRRRAAEAADVMIALHACDTATDEALAAGVRAGAAVIVCSPCCHKELRPQMHSPPALRGLLRHGIHLGQEAEMVTDGLRALLLESQGYDTQVFEFVALEHSSKNKMILAVRRASGDAAEPRRRAEALRQAAEIKAFYGVRQQRLETLLSAASVEPRALDDF